MAVTDPVADMLTRVRNASNAKFEWVDVPYAKLKWAVARILEEEGYVRSTEKRQSDNSVPMIRLYLKYDKDKQGAIFGLKRVSKSSRRTYVNKDQIPRVRGGLGTAIISTSKGVLTDKQARKEGIGGEVLCFIW